MKTLILAALFLISFQASVQVSAAVNEASIKGKITSFDQKFVTIEFAGETYKFNREKLGPEFASIRKGDTVELSLDKPATAKAAGQ